MAKNDLNEALALIDLHKEDCFCRPGSQIQEIIKAENKLGIKLSISYITFLKKFSYWSFEGSEIFGLYNDSIIRITEEQRSTNDNPTFPHSFVPIHALGNGEFSCLDTSQMNEDGECPVVAWYFGPTKPGGKYKVLAEDFGAFLLEKVKWGLESLKEEATQK